MMDNPFVNFGRPVTGDRLVGRNEIVEDIFQALLSGANYSLSGLHRIGKTSIGNEVLNRIRTKNADIRCASVTVGASHSENELYQDIADELFPEDNFDSQSSDVWRDFKRFLVQHRTSCMNIVMLDELDNLSNYDNAPCIINRLRTLAHDDKYNLAFLFISSRTLLCIQNKCCGSNLAGICHPKSIKPFADKTPLETMLARCHVSSPEVTDLFYRLTGGHPFLAEMLLCNAFEIGSKNGSEINTAVLQQGLQQSINGFNDYYRSLKSFLNDWGEDYWNKLCNYTIGPLLEPEDYTLVNDFRSYGLMSDSIHEWGGGMSEHFQQYMEYERRITPIWPQIGDIERFLRKLIQPQLEIQFGADWFLESSTQKDPFYASIFNELRILMNREQKRHGLGNSSDLLEYAYPGTLKDIILHDWKHYQKVFCDKKNDFISNIDAICLIRNPLAHHRSPKLISPELVEKARQACDTLQNQISNWIADPEKT